MSNFPSNIQSNNNSIVSYSLIERMWLRVPNLISIVDTAIRYIQQWIFGQKVPALPEEIWVNIFSKNFEQFPSEKVLSEFTRLRKVNRLFRDTVLIAFTAHITNKRLMFRDLGLTDGTRALNLVKTFENTWLHLNIKSLYFKNCEFVDGRDLSTEQLKEKVKEYEWIAQHGNIRILLSCTHLKGLVAGTNQVGISGLEYLNRLTNLQSLVFYYDPQIDDPEHPEFDGYHYLPKNDLLNLLPLSQLTKLSIHRTEIGEDELEKIIDHLTLLEDLEIEGTTREKLPPLNKGLANIGKIKNLRKLSLQKIPLQEQQLPFIGGCKKLERFCFSFSSTLTGVTLSFLPDLRKLRELFLVATDLNDQGMFYIGKCENLETLDIAHCPQINNGFLFISSLKQLKVLDLRHTKIQNIYLMNIKQCSKLSSLHLQSCPAITFKGLLPHLRELKHLEFLNISGSCTITEDEARSLINELSIKQLRYNDHENFPYIMDVEN